MLELATTSEQTLAPGQAVTFDIAIWDKGCWENWRRLSSTVSFNDNIPNCAIFDVEFSANVGGTVAATPVQLQLYLGNSPLPETLSISTPAAVGDLNNISNSTWVPGNDGSITLVNSSTTNTIVVGAGAKLKVVRVA